MSCAFADFGIRFALYEMNRIDKAFLHETVDNRMTKYKVIGIKTGR